MDYSSILYQGWGLFQKRHKARMLCIARYRKWYDLRSANVGKITGIATELHPKQTINRAKIIFSMSKKKFLKQTKENVKKDEKQLEILCESFKKFEEVDEKLRSALSHVSTILDKPSLEDLYQRMNGLPVRDRSFSSETDEVSISHNSSGVLEFFDTLLGSDLKKLFCKFLMEFDSLTDVSLSVFPKQLDMNHTRKLIKPKTPAMDLHALADELNAEKEAVKDLITLTLDETKVKDEDLTEFEYDSVSLMPLPNGLNYQPNLSTSSSSGDDTDMDGWEYLEYENDDSEIII